MTYREYAEKNYPYKVDDRYDGGVKGCPCDLIPGANDLCSDHRCSLPNDYECTACWNQTMPGTEEKEPAILDSQNIVRNVNLEPVDSSMIISGIIDDAMAKKDRSVMIFISKIGTTISVLPLDDKKPRWIVDGNLYACSECGNHEHLISPYCALCGEKLAEPEIGEKK